MLSKKISENIKRFRELKRLTREDMSSLLNMSTSGYAKIEQGMVDININKLEKVANILGVDIKQLMDFNPVEILQGVSTNKEVNSDISKINSKSSHQDLKYLEKLVQSLERENELLRDVISKK